MHLGQHLFFNLFLLPLFDFKAFTSNLEHFLVLLFDCLHLHLLRHPLGLDLLIQDQAHLLLLGFELVLLSLLDFLVYHISVPVDLPPFIGADVGWDVFNLLFAANNSCRADDSERGWLNVW